ncbi:MAG: hypothetical protein J5526_05510 [Bacteroidales bacterium]|nr:hypothetical protein [Bacteroidales bacterium]
MKKFVLLLAFVTALSCCFAQHQGDKELSIDKSQVKSAKVMEKSEKRTGAQPKYKYKIEKIDVDEGNAMDAKLNLSASNRNHKITVRSDQGNGRIAWVLLSEDGTQLDENWWIGNSTSIAFGRYGEGNFYLDFTDALGKQARYKVIKKIN